MGLFGAVGCVAPPNARAVRQPSCDDGAVTKRPRPGFWAVRTEVDEPGACAPHSGQELDGFCPGAHDPGTGSTAGRRQVPANTLLGGYQAPEGPREAPRCPGGPQNSRWELLGLLRS